MKKVSSISASKEEKTNTILQSPLLEKIEILQSNLLINSLRIKLKFSMTVLNKQTYGERIYMTI